MLPKVVLCYCRFGPADLEEVHDDADIDAEDLDQGPRSSYYLAGIMVNRKCFLNPALANMKDRVKDPVALPPKNEVTRVLDLLVQWCDDEAVVRAVQEAPEVIGHYIVAFWVNLEGEDNTRFLETDPDVDGCDTAGSWFLPDEVETAE